MKVKWTGRTDPLIAECAEALGLDTDQIMGLRNDPTSGEVTALYSPEPGDDPQIWSAWLKRNAVGVLYVQRSGPVGQTFSEFMDQGELARRMREKFGEPG